MLPPPPPHSHDDGRRVLRRQLGHLPRQPQARAAQRRVPLWQGAWPAPGVHTVLRCRAVTPCNTVCRRRWTSWRSRTIFWGTTCSTTTTSPPATGRTRPRGSRSSGSRPETADCWLRGNVKTINEGSDLGTSHNLTIDSSAQNICYPTFICSGNENLQNVPL